MLVELLVSTAIIAPLVASAISLLSRSEKVSGAISTLASLAMLVCSAILLHKGFTGTLVYGEFIISPLTSYNMLIVALVYLIASMALPASLQELREEGGHWIEFYPFALNLTFALLALLVLSDNYFIMWVLLEVTTLLTVYMVALRGGKGAEAAWKYLILCGVGMAFSLYGFVLIYSVGVKHGIETPWLISSMAKAHIETPLLVLAGLFIAAGLTVKAGLFPAYMWLPDAHSEAPHPVSALLSGVLIYAPIYVLLRVFNIIPVGVCHLLLVILALASILVGAAGILYTRDIKRLYAYSSIEHMGILTLLAALYHLLGGNQLALIAFNIHALAHAVAKAAAFIASGHLAYLERTRLVDKLDVSVFRGLGWSLVGHTIALAGMPPFPLFVSELLTFLVATSYNIVLAVAYGIFIMCAFASLGYRLLQIYSARIPTSKAANSSYTRLVTLASLLALVILLFVTLALLLGVSLHGVWGGGL